MNMNKYWLHITFGIVLVLLVGIAIPKLTVHDTVPVGVDRSCIDSALRLEGLHPIQLLLYSTGAFQVTKAEPGGGEVKFYTLFRIPLDTMRTICDYTVTEYKSDQFGISFNYPINYVLSEGNGEGSAADAYFIGLTPRPSPTPELPPGTQVDLEPSPGIHFGFYREADQADSFDEWVRKQMIYRAGPDNVQEPIFHSITVGGVSAVRYLDASGFYQRDTVLLKHGDWMVQIAADDATYFKTDFDSVLSSITFH